MKYSGIHLKDGGNRKNRTSVSLVENSLTTSDALPRECCSASRVWRSLDDSEIKASPTPHKINDYAWNRRDMSTFTIVLILLLIGMSIAANTTRPVFWLLVGPLPLSIGYALSAFLKQGFRRRVICKTKRRLGALDNAFDN